MMDLFSTVASAGSGGIFGSLMALGSAWVKGRQIKSQHIIDMEMRRFELSIAKEGHIQDIERIRQQASGDGLLASLQADAAVQNISPWAANIKAVFRPFLTTVLIVMATLIVLQLLDAYTGTENMANTLFDADEIVGMLRYAVYSLVFATTTAIAWWFGERGLTPPRYK